MRSEWFARWAFPALSAIALSLPAPAAPVETLYLATCNGGMVSLQVRREEAPAGGQHDTPGKCCSQACHVGERRKRLAGTGPCC